MVGRMVGFKVGRMVGFKVGRIVGGLVGGLVGGSVGGLLGGKVGGLVGDEVGGFVGGPDGGFVGSPVGDKVGSRVGDMDHDIVGSSLSDSVGDSVGEFVAFCFFFGDSLGHNAFQGSVTSFPFIGLGLVWLTRNCGSIFRSPRAHPIPKPAPRRMRAKATIKRIFLFVSEPSRGTDVFPASRDAFISRGSSSVDTLEIMVAAPSKEDSRTIVLIAEIDVDSGVVGGVGSPSLVFCGLPSLEFRMML